MGSRVVFYKVTSENDSTFCTSEIGVLTPHFLHERCPSMWQSGLSFFVSLCFQNNLLFLLLNFVRLPGWNRFELHPFHLSTAAFASGIFIAWGISEQTCAPICNVSSSCILCLRCELHDLLVDMIPNLVSWTHEPPRRMHALSLESGWIHHSSLQFPESRSASLFLFCARHCRIHRNFQLSPNASQSSSIVEFWLLVCPCLLFFLLSGFSQFGPDFRPQILRSGSYWNFLSVSTRTTYIPLEVSFNKVNFIFLDAFSERGRPLELYFTCN